MHTPAALADTQAVSAEDSEVWEVILVLMGVRRVCSHKGFKLLSMYIDTVQYYRNGGKI